MFAKRETKTPPRAPDAGTFNVQGLRGPTPTDKNVKVIAEEFCPVQGGHIFQRVAGDLQCRLCGGWRESDTLNPVTEISQLDRDAPSPSRYPFTGDFEAPCTHEQCGSRPFTRVSATERQCGLCNRIVPRPPNEVGKDV